MGKWYSGYLRFGSVWVKQVFKAIKTFFYINVIDGQLHPPSMSSFHSII